jgi:hypothetical protein
MDVLLDLHSSAPDDPTFFCVLDRQMLPDRAHVFREGFIDLRYPHSSKGLPFIPTGNRRKLTGPDYHSF